MRLPREGSADHDLAFESLPNWMRSAFLRSRSRMGEARRASSARLPGHARSVHGAAPVPTVPRTRETEEVLGSCSARRGQPRQHHRPPRAGRLRERRSQPPSRTTTAWSMHSTTISVLSVRLEPAQRAGQAVCRDVGTRPGFVDVEDAERELALVLEHRTASSSSTTRGTRRTSFVHTRRRRLLEAHHHPLTRCRRRCQPRRD